MLKFLSTLRDEAVNNFRAIDLNQDGENVKATVAKVRTQYNIANLLLNLPKAVKETAEAQDRAQAKVIAFKTSQEGGNI